MKLKITQEQFKAIYTLVCHVRLGRGTSLNTSMTTLLEYLEEKAYEADIDEQTLPTLTAEFNDAEGIVLNLE